eukprot:Platyproteum_vivax@DN1625_c0_g1_i1.p1
MDEDSAIFLESEREAPRSFFSRCCGAMQKGSVRGSVFTLACTAMGAGVLGLPAVLCEAGVFVGVFLLITIGVGAWLSAHCMLESSNRLGARLDPSYTRHCSTVFGPLLGAVVTVSSALYCYGGVVGYLVIIGDLLPNITEWIGWPPLDRILCIVLPALAVSLPLSLQPSVASLKNVGFFGVFSILYVTLCVMCAAPFHIQAWSQTLSWQLAIQWWPQSWFSVLNCVGVAIFAFAFHQNVFPVFAELDCPIKRRTNKVIVRVAGIATVLYVAVSLTGYLSFLTKTPSLIISAEAYPISTYPFVAVSRVLVPVQLILALPLALIPCRDAVMVFFTPPLQINEERLIVSENDNATPSHFMKVTVTISILASALIVAILSKQVLVVLNILGGFLATLICFAIPGLLYVGTHKVVFKISTPIAQNIVIEDTPPTAKDYWKLFGVVSVLGLCTVTGFASGCLTVYQ